MCLWSDLVFVLIVILLLVLQGGGQQFPDSSEPAEAESALQPPADVGQHLDRPAHRHLHDGPS